jgi:hypothetical protein
MGATLTIKLDPDFFQLAEQEAKARHTTLTGVVAHHNRNRAVFAGRVPQPGVWV